MHYLVLEFYVEDIVGVVRDRQKEVVVKFGFQFRARRQGWRNLKDDARGQTLHRESNTNSHREHSPSYSFINELSPGSRIRAEALYLERPTQPVRIEEEIFYPATYWQDLGSLL